jgi:hypothetical protein
MHNLVSAAAATGVNRSTILRAIKTGRISAQRDETNGWQIDPAELHRVFPPLPSGATTATQLGATTDALVAELRAVIADLRRDRDAWREAFENAQRLLPPPPQPDAIAMPALSNTPPAASGAGCGRPGALRARACCSPYRPCPPVLNSSSRNSSRRRDASRLR